MNYSNLFPKLLKNVPTISESSFCYNSGTKPNYNKTREKTRIYIPSGKRQLLWFTKYGSDYYSVLLEVNRARVVRCHFKYIAFDPILTSTNGTLIWVTQVGQELSLNKLLYLRGKAFTSKIPRDHMNELQYLLDNYINNIPHSSLLQLKLPAMNSQQGILTYAGNLNYLTHSAIHLDTGFTINLMNYVAYFQISVIDHNSDTYQLSCYNARGELVRYQNAMVNNVKSSRFVKDILKLRGKDYKNVEYSDDEEGETNNDVDESSKTAKIGCLYISTLDRWLPYKRCMKNVDINTESQIKNIREKSLRLLY